MNIMNEPIKVVDLKKIDATSFVRQSVGCVILTHDKKILLQQRSHDWHIFPDCLATFGGHIEANETPAQALVRELNEELGAQVNPSEVINLGAITEAVTNYSELIYVYFWHDKHHSITGCYECEAKFYTNCAQAMQHPKIMDDVRWLLKECKKRKILR